MDKQLEVLVRQAVSEGITSAWWVSFLILFFTVIASCLSGYLIAYGKKKGENLATKEDFDMLLRQVKQTTEATEEIKAKMSKGTSVGQSALEYRKQQLSEFYGPIYANLKLVTELYGIWKDQKLREINAEILKTFRTQNEEIVKIITTKAHLIDDDHIPEVFTRFMTSTTIWNLFTSRSEKPWVDEDVASLEQAKWSKEFEQYIFSKTEQLKKDLDELHKKYGVT